MNKRFLTVSRINQPSRRLWKDSKPVASIRLTGLWVEKLGFEIGDRIMVRESPGRIELVANWKENHDQLQGEDHGPHR